jgi:molecular chaperone GrpE
MKKVSTTKKVKSIKKKPTQTSKLKKLNSTIKELKEEVLFFKDKNLRLLADFENYKKRSNQNLIASYDKNLEKVASSFLPIVDDIERIIENDSANDQKIIIEGVLMIKSKIDKILNGFEISTFDSKGEIFNPDFHEAIMAQESKEKNNIIINEFEKGYKLNDKILRHAKVIVSKGKK